MDFLQAALAADPTYPAILTNLVIQLVFWTLYFELSPSYIWKPLLQCMPFWKRCNGLKTNEGMPLHNEILLGVLIPPFSSRPFPRAHAPPTPSPPPSPAGHRCHPALHWRRAHGIRVVYWRRRVLPVGWCDGRYSIPNPNPDNPQP